VLTSGQFGSVGWRTFVVMISKRVPSCVVLRRQQYLNTNE